MKRIWNALIYGDAETKKCIGSVLFCSILAIVLIVISGISGQFSIFIIGMIAAIFAIMISQTFTLVDDDFVAEVNRDGDKDTVRTVSVVKNEMIYGTKNEKKDGLGKKQEVSELSQNQLEFDTDINLEDLTLLDANDKRQDKQKENEVEDIERFEKYNQQVLKRIKKKYRIRRDHRPIIIDYSESYRIKQCPAFIWRAHNKVFLLLLEKEPRRICISREFIHNMGYKPNVRADKEKEYIAFQKENLVTKVFEEYLPDYHDSRVKNDPLKIKNLYTIYPDICLTNRSAFQVMDLLLLNFMPQDKITQSDKINGFFKRIYSAHILYKDSVYSITEYKEAVEKALGEMCRAEIPKREFVITLENLVNARLISDQYADYYMALRERLRAKTD